MIIKENKKREEIKKFSFLNLSDEIKNGF